MDDLEQRLRNTFNARSGELRPIADPVVRVRTGERGAEAL